MISLLTLLSLSITIFMVMENKTIVNNSIIHAILSCIVGAILLSYSYTVSLFCHVNPKIIQFILILTCWLYTSLNIKILKKTLQTQFCFTVKTSSWVIGLLSLLIFTVFFLFFSEKWGAWDAWAIWSLHAKFLTFQDNYIYLFKFTSIYSHTDYPLMLPSFIASIWSSFNNISAIVPLLTAFFSSVSLILLSSASLIGKSQTKYWILSLVFLCVSPIVYRTGSYQYADTLLALFFLIPFIILNNTSKLNKYTLLFLGFFVASAAFVKNEGIVFFLIFSVLFFFNRKKMNTWYILGAFGPLLIITYFKIKIAPTNDLIAEQDIGFLSKLFEIKRYGTILLHAVKNLINIHLPVTLLIISLLILNFKRLKEFGYNVIFIMLFSYFMVYVLTPKNLEWHLTTSFGRLIHHVTPALFYLLILSTIQNKTLNLKINHLIHVFKLDNILKQADKDF
ncbi:hypothetical protein AAFN75_12635 [Algibacter sp. AS12]|uniref:hypothetical protein n=1 Tax=Algibacter sp. AS12 TaxID=3135773 RepID=UPI00398A8599